jgi:hypothetical protein
MESAAIMRRFDGRSNGREEFRGKGDIPELALDVNPRLGIAVIKRIVEPDQGKTRDAISSAER